MDEEMLENHWVTVKHLKQKLGGVCSSDSIRVILKNKLIIERFLPGGCPTVLRRPQEAARKSR